VMEFPRLSGLIRHDFESLSIVAKTPNSYFIP
jgi:hypothetical protein